MSNWDAFITWHPVGNCGALHIKSLKTGDVDEFDNAFVRSCDHISFIPPDGVTWGVDALEAIVEAMRLSEETT